MILSMRIWLGTGIFLLDFLTPFIPVCSIIFMVACIARPKWFKRLIDEIYKGD